MRLRHSVALRATLLTVVNPFLIQRGRVLQVVPLTRSGKKLDEFSMVFYNNLLSLPLLAVVAAINGEWTTFLAEPALRNPGFQLAAGLSALCGFLISFCSLWFLSTTTATTYSLVGSLNKVCTAALHHKPPLALWHGQPP